MGDSINQFSNFSQSKRDKFKVISGHGSIFLQEYLENFCLVTIIRNPEKMFLSQYEFLRQSKETDFLESVSKLDSIEEYIEYSKKMGQDNLLVRYFSESLNFIFDPSKKVPDLSKNGQVLLKIAKKNIQKYSLIFDLSEFDKGVNLMSQLLNWKKNPFYRPSNRSKYEKIHHLKPETIEKIKNLLKWDIELYQFIKENYSLPSYGFKNSIQSTIFFQRQKLIKFGTQLLRKY